MKNEKNEGVALPQKERFGQVREGSDYGTYHTWKEYCAVQL